MKLIIGLGNPGREYENTRHNAGFLFLDALQEKYNLPQFKLNKKFNAQITEGFTQNQEKIILAKPQTFMNHSGRSVQSLITFYKIAPEDIIVVADDLDIEIGNYKISRDIRAAGHNGVQHIIDNLSTQDFTRIRLGVEKLGGRSKRGQISGHDFVLQNFSDEELKLLNNAISEILENI